MNATALLLSAGLLLGAPVPKELAKSNIVVLDTSLGAITIAVARAVAADSGDAQFFINTKDNLTLDFSDRNAGYCVFGKVIKGLDVVDKNRGGRSG